MNAIEIFQEDFPVELLKRITAGLRDCYRMARDAVRDSFRNSEVRSNAYPGWRRAHIEDMLMATASDFGGSVSVKQAGGEYFWFHVEVRSGRVVLTQNASSDEEAPLRTAIYKRQLAWRSQPLLFPDSHDIRPDACLFASLLHNKMADDAAQIGFAQIKFPKTNHVGVLDGFHHGHLDLRTQFHELFVDQTSVEEKIEDTAIPEPLKAQKSE